MSLETQVHSRISALNGGKVYAIKAPDGTAWPVIVWQRIDAVPEESHDATAGLYRSRVQVTAYAATATAARSLRDSCVTALEGNHADGAITVADKSEGFEDGAGVFRADADFYVWANN